MANGNGNAEMKKVVWWIMGIVAIFFTTGATMWAHSVNSHLKSIDDGVLLRVERLRAVEEQTKTLKDGIIRIEKQQDLMDDKLDQLLRRPR